VTPEAVDAYIAQRNDALANKLPVPPFPQAQGFAAGATPVWRIRAEARMPNGVTFVRDAVLRPSVDVRRPMIALLWQEGARTPPPQTTAQNGETGAPMATGFNNGQFHR
jgi:general secretion pathway protein K